MSTTDIFIHTHTDPSGLGFCLFDSQHNSGWIVCFTPSFLPPEGIQLHLAPTISSENQQSTVNKLCFSVGYLESQRRHSG